MNKLKTTKQHASLFMIKYRTEMTTSFVESLFDFSFLRKSFSRILDQVSLSKKVGIETLTTEG